MEIEKHNELNLWSGYGRESYKFYLSVIFKDFWASDLLIYPIWLIYDRSKDKPEVFILQLWNCLSSVKVNNNANKNEWMNEWKVRREESHFAPK